MKPLTEDRLGLLVTGAAEILVRPLRAQMAALEAEVKALKARPTVKYSGVWQHDHAYEIGELVTKNGSIWHSNVSNNHAVPGEHPTCWTLAAKRGADGKDAR
jgi:hypothetical protein